jgi:hypothetical protein
VSKQYRNVTVRPDGGIEGEYRDLRYPQDSWIKFGGTPALMRIRHVIDEGGQTAYRAFWRIQDGYGRPGVTPPQGIDWSGIRDSSDAAVAQMDAMACKLHPGMWPWEVAMARDRLVEAGTPRPMRYAGSLPAWRPRAATPAS